jgi:hypothetical protein
MAAIEQSAFRAKHFHSRVIEQRARRIVLEFDPPVDIRPELLRGRHASVVCAVLRHERYVQCSLDGSAVIVTFNA